MPINASPQFNKAQAEFLLSKTLEEKVEKLKVMISLAPKHKGGEKLRVNLRTRLAKLKKELQRRKKVKKHKAEGIKKEGDAQITLLGYANSGKSLLLNSLTRAKSAVSKFPYTTKKPAQGMLELGAQIQVLDLPSLKDKGDDSEILGYANNSDIVLIIESSVNNIRKILQKIKSRNKIIIINKQDIIKQNEINKIKKEFPNAIEISALSGRGVMTLKKRIFDSLNIIKIYTKQPGRRPETRPIILKKDAKVDGLARKIHKDFIKNFKFAKIWRQDTFQRVGLKYKLKDEDVVELHI